MDSIQAHIVPLRAMKPHSRGSNAFDASLPLQPDSSALRQSVRFWDKMARKYAASKIADEAGYEATLRRTSDLLTPSDRVLEIGCGTGTTALRLAPRVKHWHATDHSPHMVAIANEKLLATPTGPLEFEVADADSAAQRAPQAYDAVVAFNVLHLLPDVADGIAAVSRALRPGGLFISKTPCVGEMNVLIPWVVLPLARLVGLAPPVHCLVGGELENAIASHGFELLVVERHGTKGRDVRPFIVARKLNQAATK